MINPNRYIKREQDQYIYTDVHQGGDERYLWSLNRRAQTFSIFDLATHTLVGTITLTAAKTFLTAHYRPVNKCVYCFGSDTVDVIDLDPTSGTWATKITSIAYTPSAGQESIYDGANDMFYVGNKWFSGNILISGTLPITMNSAETYYASRRLMAITDTSVVQYGFYDLSGTKPELIKPSGFLQLVGPTFAPRLINNNWYTLRGGTCYRFSDYPYYKLEASISTTTSLFRGDTAYDPVNKRLFACGPLNTPLNVIDISGFTNLGNAPRTSPDTNEAGTSNLIYSKYSGFIYAKGGNIGNVTGCARIHYYNPALAVASMWQNYLTAGEDSIATNPYSNHTMGLNSLKTYDK